MYRIDGANPGPGNSWVDGDPQTGVPGTQATGHWLTEIQEELAEVVESAGLTLVKGNRTQLLEGLRLLARSQRARRNVLVNGDFTVSQRWGISNARSLTSGQSAFNADRWIHSPGTGGGAGNTTRFITLPVAARIATGGARYGYAVAQSVAGTDPYLEQRVENVWTLEGRVCTVSLFADVFAIGAGGASIDVDVEIVQHFGSGGSADVVTAGPTLTMFLAGTDYVRYSGQVTVPSVAGKVIAAAGSYVAVRFIFPSGVTWSVELTAIQFEEGPIATPYDVRPYQEELAACWRFYQATGEVEFSGSLPGQVSSSPACLKTYAAGTDGRPLDVRFPVQMRKIPTVVWYAPSSGAANSVDWEGGVRAVTAQFETSALGPGWPRVGSARALSALEANYTADAEL